jgi:hypothetical protein
MSGASISDRVPGLLGDHLHQELLHVHGGGGGRRSGDRRGARGGGRRGAGRGRRGWDRGGVDGGRGGVDGGRGRGRVDGGGGGVDGLGQGKGQGLGLGGGGVAPAGHPAQPMEARLDRPQELLVALRHRPLVGGVGLHGGPLGLLEGQDPGIGGGLRVLRHERSGGVGRGVRLDIDGLLDDLLDVDGLLDDLLDVDGLLDHAAALARGEAGAHGVRRVAALGAGARRVRLAVVAAVDLDRHLRDRPRVRVRGGGVPRPQRAERLAVAGHEQAAERGEQLADAVLLAAIEADGHVRPRPQGLGHEVGEHLTGADLHERPGARGVHRLDLVDEPHRLGHRGGDPGLHGVRAGLVRGGGRVVPAGEGGLREGDVLQERRERLDGAGHHGRVEGGRHLQALGLDAGGQQAPLERGHRVGRARHHHLLRRVVVGHHTPGDRVHVGLDDVDRGGDGRHRAGRGGGAGHQLAAAAGDADGVRRRQHPGGVQRGDLAVAVASDEVRPEPEGLGERQQRERRHADRGLGPLGLAQLVLLPAFGVRVEPGAREHDAVHRRRALAHLQVGGGVPRRPRPVEEHRHVAAHADVLGALAREQERHGSRLLAPSRTTSRWAGGTAPPGTW